MQMHHTTIISLPITCKENNNSLRLNQSTPQPYDP